MNLRNRYGPWALVTGASSGIGRAFTQQIASQGVNLFIIGRNQSSLESLKIELSLTHSIEIVTIVADLSTREGVQTVLTDSKVHDVGLFVSSAGFGSSGRFEELELRAGLEMVDLNCRATVELTHELGGRMLQKGRGGIVLLSSLLSWQGAPGAATYAATKGFVQSFAEGLHSEWKTRGVDVIACAPGPVLTNFDGRASMTILNGDRPETVARQTLKKLGRGSLVVPGRYSKFLTYSLLPLPRRLRVNFMARVMRTLSKNRIGD